MFVVDQPYPATLLPPMRKALEAIGIAFNLRRVPRATWVTSTAPDKHVAVNANRWGNDFPGGSAFFPQLFSSASFTSPNPADSDTSLLGANPQQLRSWGYRISKVPNVDAEIARCGTLVGEQQVRCWATLDQDLMENIVPWIPFMFQTNARMVSTRVVGYSFDQFTGEPALDQLAISAGT